MPGLNGLDEHVDTETDGGGGSSYGTEGSTAGSTTGPGDTTGEVTTMGPTSGSSGETEDLDPWFCTFTAAGQSESFTVTENTDIVVELEACDDLGLAEVTYTLTLGNASYTETFDNLGDGVTEFTLPDVEWDNFALFSEAQNSEPKYELTAYAEDDAGQWVEKTIKITVDLNEPDSPDPAEWTHEYHHPEDPQPPSEYYDVTTSPVDGSIWAVGYWNEGEMSSRRALVVKIDPNNPQADENQLCAAHPNFVANNLMHSEARGVAINSDGDAIVVGALLTGDGDTLMWARRFTSDCQEDPNWKIQSEPDQDRFALDVAIDDKDQIYVTGYEGKLGQESNLLVQRYEWPFTTVQGSATDNVNGYKYRLGWDITVDNERDLVFVAGASTTAPAFSDQRMMVAAFTTPGLGSPKALEIFDGEMNAPTSEGLGVRVRADGYVMVAGYRREQGEYSVGHTWEYLYNENDESFSLDDDNALDTGNLFTGDERATGIAVSPEIALLGENEWAVSMYGIITIDNEPKAKGAAQKFGINDELLWDVGLPQLSRYQATEFDKVGYIYAAGYWKKNINERTIGVVHKMPYQP